MIRYCKWCVLPDSRPHLKLDAEGVCSACRRHNQKPSIDWTGRKIQFLKLCEEVRSRDRDYDCVIPVSGGKDSTWQVAMCLEQGLKPLAVTWRSPGRTAIGQRNLDNLISLGVDHIDYSINPDIERAFMLRTFEKAGSTAIPMHLAIFSIPLRIASAFNIPLVVYGENSASEYGGRDEDARSELLDSNWVQRYGVTQGTVAADWTDTELTARDLLAYSPPSSHTLESAGIKSVFLGHYFPWDPQTTRDAAIKSGFEIDSSGPRTGLFDYADIDDDFISLHHWMKWYKFGFTRTYDNLSLEIRNGRMTRDEAVETLRQRGDETPWEDLQMLSSFAGVSVEWLLSIAETFRSEEVWDRRPDGIWEIPGFLISEWQWS
ncbi:MAG: N-acetyl sugar amidotransferase [Candidatus Nanopelagicales bacterium]|nr:N-acetyl sugar amidotransferase [Candidatus Nanopelagicales bacterium]